MKTALDTGQPYFQPGQVDFVVLHFSENEVYIAKYTSCVNFPNASCSLIMSLLTKFSL